MYKPSSHTRALIFLLLYVISGATAFAQYEGGSGHGQGSASVAALALAASGTGYSGGAGNGNTAFAASLLSLSIVSQYSGGTDDGNAALSISALSLVTNTSYAGGSDDGAVTAGASNISLATTGMYSGGSDDGTALLSMPALDMSAGGNYSGGTEDGAATMSASALSLGIQSMYAGGADDGTVNLLAASLLMSPTSSMNSGGSGSGFASLSALQLGIALPLKWNSFEVMKQGADALLLWETSNEPGTESFKIERSFDGISFSGIGSVAATGGVFAYNEYRFIDADPAAACKNRACDIVYYRIQELDVSGASHYSPIRSLKPDMRQAELMVYPNPVSDKIYIRAQGANGSVNGYRIVMYNNVGNAVYRCDNPSWPVQEVDVSSLPSGVYSMQINTGAITYQYRLVITH